MRLDDRLRPALRIARSYPLTSAVGARAATAQVLLAGIPPKLPPDAEPAAVHSWWRCQRRVEPSGFLALRQPGTGEAVAALVLDQVEAERLRSRGIPEQQALAQLVHEAWDTAHRRSLTGWADDDDPAPAPLGEPWARLGLRADALGFGTFDGRPAPRRRLAELAFEEGELLALRLPRPAADLLLRAHDEFHATGDDAGALIAAIRATLALLHAGDKDRAANVMTRLVEPAYARVFGSGGEWPTWDEIASYRDPVPPGARSWSGWLHRLKACHALLADNPEAARHLTPDGPATSPELDGSLLPPSTPKSRTRAPAPPPSAVPRIPPPPRAPPLPPAHLPPSPAPRPEFARPSRTGPWWYPSPVSTLAVGLTVGLILSALLGRAGSFLAGLAATAVALTAVAAARVLRFQRWSSATPQTGPRIRKRGVLEVTPGASPEMAELRSGGQGRGVVARRRALRVERLLNSRGVSLGPPGHRLEDLSKHTGDQPKGRWRRWLRRAMHVPLGVHPVLAVHPWEGWLTPPGDAARPPLVFSRVPSPPGDPGAGPSRARGRRGPVVIAASRTWLRTAENAWKPASPAVVVLSEVERSSAPRVLHVIGTPLETAGGLASPHRRAVIGR